MSGPHAIPAAAGLSTAADLDAEVSDSSPLRVKITLGVVVFGVVVGAFGFASIKADIATNAEEVHRAKIELDDRTPRIQKIETDTALLKQALEQHGRAIDEMRGDVRELLRRVPAPR